MQKRKFSITTVLPLIVIGYVLIEVYAVWKIYTGLRLPAYLVPVLALWVALMTFSLPLLWQWEHRGWHRLSTVMAWIGFGWMGWVFLFFWISLSLDLLSLIAGIVLPASWAERTAMLGAFPIAALLSLVIAAYGFVDARRIRIERVAISSAKLPAGTTFRLALISDVHLGVLVGARRLGRLIEQLRKLDADVVVSAGDLVDGLEDRLRELAPMFDSLRPRYGKFAVTGNHEYYAGIEHALDFHARAGFRVLRAAAVDVTESITIVGVDDPTGRSGFSDERIPLSRITRDRFAILLKHQPVLGRETDALFDLQLSGHVHRGQIFPFGWLVRIMYPVRTGLTRLVGGAWVYVSRGTGTWGPPMRIGAAPEISLIELHAAS